MPVVRERERGMLRLRTINLKHPNYLATGLATNVSLKYRRGLFKHGRLFSAGTHNPWSDCARSPSKAGDMQPSRPIRGRDRIARDDIKRRPFESRLIPGKDSMAKDFAIRLMRLVQVEFNLPRKYINIMCEEFQALDKAPIYIETFSTKTDYDRKVYISENEYGIFKYIDGDGMYVKMYVKEVCIYHHLKELQGTKIPRMVSYGVIDALGEPGFFLLVEHYGDVLDPSQVSASELGELLSEIHARGILLTGRDFPTLMRCGCTMVLANLSTAVFGERKTLFIEEFNYFTSLCKKDNGN